MQLLGRPFHGNSVARPELVGALNAAALASSSSSSRGGSDDSSSSSTNCAYKWCQQHWSRGSPWDTPGPREVPQGLGFAHTSTQLRVYSQQPKDSTRYLNHTRELARRCVSSLGAALP